MRFFLIIGLVVVLGGCSSGGNDDPNDTVDTNIESNAGNNGAEGDVASSDNNAEEGVENNDNNAEVVYETSLLDAEMYMYYNDFTQLIDSGHESNDEVLAAQGKLGSGQHLVDYQTLVNANVGAFIDSTEGYISNVVSLRPLSGPDIKSVIDKYEVLWLLYVIDELAGSHFSSASTSARDTIEGELRDSITNYFTALELRLIAVSIL